jgi:hypothetical protein
MREVISVTRIPPCVQAAANDPDANAKFESDASDQLVTDRYTGDLSGRSNCDSPCVTLCWEIFHRIARRTPCESRPIYRAERIVLRAASRATQLQAVSATSANFVENMDPSTERIMSSEIMIRHNDCACPRFRIDSYHAPLSSCRPEQTSRFLCVLS